MKRFLGQLVRIYPIGLICCLLAAAFFDIWIFAMLMYAGGKNIFVDVLASLALAGTIGLLFGLVKQKTASYSVISLTFMSCLTFPLIALWINKVQTPPAGVPSNASLGEILFFGAFTFQLVLFIPKLLSKRAI